MDKCFKNKLWWVKISILCLSLLQLICNCKCFLRFIQYIVNFNSVTTCISVFFVTFICLCKSIVCYNLLSAAYYSVRSDIPNSAETGKVLFYAWCDTSMGSFQFISACFSHSSRYNHSFCHEGLTHVSCSPINCALHFCIRDSD